MSTLNVANITDGTNSVETVYVARGSAKAWVQLSATPSVVDSFNVSSVTDLAVGEFQVNLTSAMTNGDYSVTGICIGSLVLASSPTQSATTYEIDTFNTSATRSDRASSSAIFGDLA